MNAADVMVSRVITVFPDTTIEEIAETLLANRISAVPVVDAHGKLLGIVSEGDLIHRVEADAERHRSWWLELLTLKEVLAREFIKSHGRKASDVMTHPVITVKPDTPLSELASVLDKHRIKRVPIVSDGKIVGIVSRANLIQALVRGSNTILPTVSIGDSALRDSVLSELRSKPWWPNDINVVVNSGTVELWGMVDSEVEMDAIRVAVEVTPGVRTVSNNLSVKHVLSAQ